MKRRLFFIGIGLALLTLAVGGWTVKGLRRARRTALRPVLRPALA
jgi:hypothetical protein